MRFLFSGIAALIAMLLNLTQWPDPDAAFISGFCSAIGITALVAFYKDGDFTN